MSEEVKRAALQQIMSPSPRPFVSCRHNPAETFQAGTALPIEVRVGGAVTQVRLKYRHVNQAEYYETVEMINDGGEYRATIPAAYTESPFALQYYFELQHSPRTATMYPGLGPDLTTRPYFLTEQG